MFWDAPVLFARADAPMAQLELPIVLVESVPPPTAVLLVPIVLPSIAKVPTAVLAIPFVVEVGWLALRAL